MVGGGGAGGGLATNTPNKQIPNGYANGGLRLPPPLTTTTTTTAATTILNTTPLTSCSSIRNHCNLQLNTKHRIGAREALTSLGLLCLGTCRMSFRFLYSKNVSQFWWHFDFPFHVFSIPFQFRCCWHCFRWYFCWKYRRVVEIRHHHHPDQLHPMTMWLYMMSHWHSVHYRYRWTYAVCSSVRYNFYFRWNYCGQLQYLAGK